MTAEEQIFTLLSGYAPLATIVGSKIYPVRAKQGAVKPWVAYFDVVGLVQNSLSGWSGTDNVVVQFDIWATTYAEAKNIAACVRTAMAQANATFRCVCRSEFDGPIDSGKEAASPIEAFHRIVEFSLWTS